MIGVLRKYSPKFLFATDDKRIAEAVEAFGGKCVMTSELHRSGFSDRCLEGIHPNQALMPT